MGTTLPLTVYSRMVDKVVTVLTSYAIYPTPQEDLIYEAKTLIEAIEIPMRECFSREISAWHDLECNKLGLDCTCRDLASIVAGKILGDEIEI